MDCRWKERVGGLGAGSSIWRRKPAEARSPKKYFSIDAIFPTFFRIAASQIKFHFYRCSFLYKPRSQTHSFVEVFSRRTQIRAANKSDKNPGV